MRSVLSFILGGSLLLAGCGTAAADLSQLPEDPAERARYCLGAANAYWGVGQVEDLEQAEMDRRKAIEDELRVATDFNDFVTEADLPALNAEITRQIDGGNWLLDLNKCKAGYRIGEAEPLPALPEDRRDRLFTCAVSSAIKGRGLDTQRQVVLQFDPQAFHFAHMLAGEEGADGIARRIGNMGQLGRSIVRQGAVDHFVDRCVEEYPTAALDRPVELPDDELLRAGICGYVAQTLSSGGAANRLSGEYGPRAVRIAGPIRAVTEREISLEQARWLQANLEREVGALGPSTSIFAACEKAYLADAEEKI